MAERHETPDMEEPGGRRGAVTSECAADGEPLARLAAVLEAWRGEELGVLRRIEGLVGRLVEAKELSVSKEPAAVPAEMPDAEEPFPTWILTDAQVARVEDAVRREQEVRGRAYGGPHG